MTSGTTEKKYSRQELLSLCYSHLKKVGADQTAAIQAFRAANDQVKEKLAKNGITISEFVDYSNLQDASA